MTQLIELSVLRQHPFFRYLEPEALDQLRRYAKYTVLKRGATLFAKDDPGNSLYAVISGTVKISVSSPDGRNAILNLVGPGELFGEMSVLDGQPRSADATANINCEIFVIDRRDFLPFVRSQPALAMKFIELLCARLRWTSDQVEQVILQDLPRRLASALLGLMEKCKAEPESHTILITQQEISEMVGMTRESINKQLGAWALRKWVRLEHRAIIVLDVAALRELTEAGTAKRLEASTRFPDISLTQPRESEGPVGASVPRSCTTSARSNCERTIWSGAMQAVGRPSSRTPPEACAPPCKIPLWRYLD